MVRKLSSLSCGILLILVLFISACGSAFISSGLGGSIDTSDQVTNSAAPEEEDPIYPDTVMYLRFENTVARLSEDGKNIEVQGYTVNDQTGNHVSSSVKITKNSEIPVIVVSNELGYFSINLPVDTNKSTELINLITINEIEEATSEPLDLVVDKLYGFWETELEINQDQIDPYCASQIPRLNELNGPRDIFSYYYDSETKEYWVKLLGVKHPFNVINEEQIVASGFYSLNEQNGFDSNITTGCYENNQYLIQGNISPQIKQDGVYITIQGDIKISLSGQDCLKTCKLNGAWQAKRYFPKSYFFQNEADDFEETKASLPGNYQIKVEKLWQLAVQNGPINSFKQKSNNQIIATTKSQVFEIEFDDKGSYFSKVIFDINKYLTKYPYDINVTCELEIEDYAIIGQDQGIITYKTTCGLPGGFYSIDFNDPQNIQHIALPHFLNLNYSYGLSPRIYHNYLLLIASNFDFEKTELSENFNELAVPVLLSYRINESKIDPIPKITQLTRAENPMVMEIWDDELMVFDASFTGINIEGLIFNQDFSGFFESFQLSTNNNQLIITPHKIYHPFGNQWPNCEYGSCNNKTPYLHDIPYLKFLNIDFKEEKLFIVGHDNNLHLPSGQNTIYAVDFSNEYDAPNINWPLLESQGSWLKTAKIHGSFAGHQLLLGDKEFLYEIGARRFEEFVQKGLLIQIRDWRYQKEINQLSNVPIIFTKTLKETGVFGSAIKFGSRIMISVDRNLYLLKKQPMHKGPEDLILAP